MSLVSIIMNCHNGSNYLHESISSVINQTYKNWEIIFWDNQSTDDSIKIAEKFNDDRIKIYNSKKFEKLGKARNNAIAKCKGEFIGFLDTDDLWYAEKLAKQIPLFANEDVGLTYSNSIFFKGSKSKLLYQNKRGLPKGNALKEILGNYNLSLETVIIRRKIIDKMDYHFDEDFNLIEERDFFTRISFHCSIDYIYEPLAKWRIHRNSLTQKNISLFGDELHLMIKKYNQFYPNIIKDNPNEINNIKMKAQLRYSQDAWREGDMKKARLMIRGYIFKSAKIFIFFIFTMIPIRIQKLFLTFFIVI